MASPYARPPHDASIDCSYGLCSIYCPQWCYFFFPPPPPPSHSPFTLSPLLIAIIVVVSSAFAIVSGYLVAVKYCSSRRRSHSGPTFSAASAWLSPPTAGLDASHINKLDTYLYRRGDGPTADADRDCSVCLSEFHDGDSLRLLPKCSHTFHRSCIDTWLGSHSSCPVCRANVVVPAERRALEMVAEGDFAVVDESEEERARR